MSHYDTLEVSDKASAETIRAAYKSLMQRYHPDRNQDDAEATARTVSIQRAYDVLSDPDKRAIYDLGREQPPSYATARQAPSPAPKPETSIFSSAVLGTVFIVVAGAIGGYLMRDTPQPMSQMSIPTGSQAQQQPASRMIELIEEVEVIPLLGDDAYRSFTGHTLAIPKMDIVIGQEDDARMRDFILFHLDEMKQALRDTLSQIPYETLLKDTAEGYIKVKAKEGLSRYIKQRTEEATNEYLLATASSSLQYTGITPLRGNIVKVILPDGFDVK